MTKLSLSATAVGSLPHTSAEDATDLIWEFFSEIPFWPQLANVSSLEDMIVQYTQNIPGVVVNREEQNYYFNPDSDEFYLDLEEFYLDYDEITAEKNFDKLNKYSITSPYTSTIEHLCKKLNTHQPKFAKGQITGPFTWGTSICDKENKCIFYDETYRDIVVKGLTLKALWQIKIIKEAYPHTKPIIFMDEPSLGQVGTSAFLTVQEDELISSLKEISQEIQKHDALSGIHCCGKADWNSIIDSGINIISFDAYSFSKSFLVHARKIKEFMLNGGYIAWGIVPTLDTEALKGATLESLTEKLETAIDSLSKKGIDKELILKQSIITPSCGAGSLDIELAKKAMKLTKEISKHLKTKYERI